MSAFARPGKRDRIFNCPKENLLGIGLRWSKTPWSTWTKDFPIYQKETQLKRKSTLEEVDAPRQKSLASHPFPLDRTSSREVSGKTRDRPKTSVVEMKGLL